MVLQLFENNEKAYRAADGMMRCTDVQFREIAAQAPSYIILDEFHRAGAGCLGAGTVALLKLCKNTRLLGLTATHVRYLDNNRNAAEERFDGHVVRMMSLGEAIGRGILPALKGVTTAFRYQKDLAKCRKRVDRLQAGFFSGGGKRCILSPGLNLGAGRIVPQRRICAGRSAGIFLTEQQTSRPERIGMQQESLAQGGVGWS